ncbi:phosphatidate cytidylyltransferase [Hyphomonas johnsonii MHS-2]|jgi:phosphatidate cytidylyltransferase|uniref:Phosphatidate cytidylyltransferase n=2 Tax=Hyphomonas johnsonii TaxID=81031 RepID=A0A059FUK1_9PROT|nr:phosphatidate cytidylyltransferase [Hyphomonas johnsonii MHS-2]
MSAAILIPAALAMVWFGGWFLAVGCSIFAAAMAREWSAISAFPRGWSMAAATALFCLSLPLGIFWLSGLVLAGGLVFCAASAPGGAPERGMAVFGLIYVTAMAAGLFFLREGDWDGRSAALYFMSFVWASDAAAYFTGRGLGGPRLLPKESPNKTWSGAIGAVTACAFCGLAVADIQMVSFAAWIAAGIAISICAQIGDLFESGLKRRFKVKDAGTLLPGHGGVLDRVDGLGAVCIFGSLALYAIPGIADALGL